eukprot:446861-Prorocentrum_minimum.AAC.1
MGSFLPMREGAAAGPFCGSLRIRENPIKSAKNRPQPRLPIGGNEPIGSILWVRGTHLGNRFRDISPYPPCQENLNSPPHFSRAIFGQVRKVGIRRPQFDS